MLIAKCLQLIHFGSFLQQKALVVQRIDELESMLVTWYQYHTEWPAAHANSQVFAADMLGILSSAESLGCSENWWICMSIPRYQYHKEWPAAHASSHVFATDTLWGLYSAESLGCSENWWITQYVYNVNHTAPISQRMPSSSLQLKNFNTQGLLLGPFGPM